MKFLIIGGTGFISRPLVRELQKRQTQVAVFQRGRTPASFNGVEIILGDRKNLEQYREDFQRFAPDTVIHMILSSGRHAEALMLTVRGIARRVVALSSMDVYRAFGLFHGTESGPLQPVPLTTRNRAATADGLRTGRSAASLLAHPQTNDRQ